MAPAALVCFTTTAPRFLLIALIHHAIAPKIPIAGDGTNLYDVGWYYYDADEIEAALSTFQTLLIGAQQANQADAMEMALNAIGFICRDYSCRDYSPEVTVATAEFPIVAEPADFEAPTTSEALLSLANHAYLTADLDQALHYYEQALRQATAQQHLTQVGLCLNGLALVYRKQHDLHRSHAYGQAAVQVFADVENSAYQGAALHNLGVTCYQLKQYGAALAHFSQALTLREQLHDCLGESMTLACMGQVYACRQEFMFALGCYQGALEACREFGRRTNVAPEEAILLGHIANVCERTRHSDLAIAYYLDALDKLQHPEENPVAAMILHRLGRLHERLGHMTIALHYYREALGKCKTQAELTKVLNHVDHVDYP